MTDPERKEAIVRLTLRGLGFDLERKFGAYVVTDRRAALDLPGAESRLRHSSKEPIHVSG
jgi:hypothetical protein